MTKDELVKRIAKNTRYPQKTVLEVLNTATKEIRNGLKEGKRVQLIGFGTFYVSKRGESKVRHIKTKEVITVPPRNVAKFRAGDLLRKAVRGK